MRPSGRGLDKPGLDQGKQRVLFLKETGSVVSPVLTIHAGHWSLCLREGGKAVYSNMHGVSRKLKKDDERNKGQDICLTHHILAFLCVYLLGMWRS